MIKLEGCVEGELKLAGVPSSHQKSSSLWTMPSSLPPQGGAPGSLHCQGAWGGRCGWTPGVSQAASPLLFHEAAATALSLGSLPWALLPSLKSQLAFSDEVRLVT